jgi:hypothetical protein
MQQRKIFLPTRGIQETVPTNIRDFEKQFLYWVNVTNEENIINPIKVVADQISLYTGNEWENEPTMIGIFKRSGETQGQNIWMNLAESQVMVKLIIKALQLQQRELQKTSDSTPITYSSVNFIDLGVKKDYVLDKSTPVKPIDPQLLHGKLVKQKDQKLVWSSKSYMVGSVEFTKTILGGKPLFGFCKHFGVAGGQRIWVSIHELQNLLTKLKDFIDIELAVLDVLE